MSKPEMLSKPVFAVCDVHAQPTYHFCAFFPRNHILLRGELLLPVYSLIIAGQRQQALASTKVTLKPTMCVSGLYDVNH